MFILTLQFNSRDWQVNDEEMEMVDRNNITISNDTLDFANYEHWKFNANKNLLKEVSLVASKLQACTSYGSNH